MLRGGLLVRGKEAVLFFVTVCENLCSVGFVLHTKSILLINTSITYLRNEKRDLRDVVSSWYLASTITSTCEMWLIARFGSFVGYIE